MLNSKSMASSTFSGAGSHPIARARETSPERSIPGTNSSRKLQLNQSRVTATRWQRVPVARLMFRRDLPRGKRRSAFLRQLRDPARIGRTGAGRCVWIRKFPRHSGKMER